ncbi:Eukaryotic elongation factor 2 kinase like protein [Argiope bruennichi]|uniref:Eukaryotic elongation factor 2 kinase like protein n=1 Tax=Argiope bruennichi TaxID=94029 RepID=A0A8T0FMV9_ARGBR|nr:Eukaryotic elongation factor 2 kinase like protein [Argiope bruennichi]
MNRPLGARTPRAPHPSISHSSFLTRNSACYCPALFHCLKRGSVVVQTPHPPPASLPARTRLVNTSPRYQISVLPWFVSTTNMALHPANPRRSGSHLRHHPAGELEDHQLTRTLSCKTRVRGTEDLCLSPSDKERVHWKEFIRARSTSGSSPTYGSFSYMSESSESVQSSKEYGLESYGSESLSCGGSSHGDDEDAGFGAEDHHFPMFTSDSGVGSAKRKRSRCESECSVTEENEIVEFAQLVSRRSRPSCVMNEEQLRELQNENEKHYSNSVLGMIHLDLAKYHEIGRFTLENEEYDHDAAFYHLEQAARCGNLEAINTLAKIYLQIPHDVLAEVSVKDSTDNIDQGMDYMKQAACAGDRAAMIFMAKCYDSGDNVNQKNWRDAVYWYEKAIKTEEIDEGGEYDACMHDPTYELLSRQAALYQKGGFGLQKDPTKAGDLYNLAAESAMSCMKGKLANKYYMYAEEAYAECDD